MTRLLPERPADHAEVEYLYDLAFAPGRTALSSYRLRAGPPVEGLSWMIRDDYDSLAAAIRFWPVLAGDAPALLLGPIAVHPTRQGEGLGRLLMRHTLDLAPDLGWSRVILVGDPPYYARFGFVHLDGVIMPPPTNPARVQGLELVPGAWEGVRGTVVHAA